ncbi:hypothetical protein MG293_002822 [Ovis ammon polii]|uniref:Uncharacterized protein n=1 Tax=Ovis ammon polii TaxID=230172 RepID=A0AAD4YGC4_OVIAM|nr:hypothetical protein MG293_002822 [Ovis ammon polii]
MEIHLLPHIILEERTGLILRPYIAIGLFRRSQTPFASPRVYWSSSELELVEKTAAPCHKEFAPHNGDGVHRVPLHHGPRDGPDPTLFFSRRRLFGKSGIFNRENLAEYKRAFEADEAKVTYCKSFKPPKYISCVC